MSLTSSPGCEQRRSSNPTDNVNLGLEDGIITILVRD